MATPWGTPAAPTGPQPAEGAGGGGGRSRPGRRARGRALPFCSSQEATHGRLRKRLGPVLPGDQDGQPDDQRHEEEPDWEEYTQPEDDPGKTHNSIQ